MVKAGVNVYGYVYAESGVGEHTRLLISALREAGIDYCVVPFTKTLSRQDSNFTDLGHPEPVFDINIIGVNADSVPLFIEDFGISAIRGRYNIGLWAWELEDFPEWMADSADLIDEVWANSSFSARSIARKILRPVQPFPLPIATPQAPPRSRGDLDLPEEFLYLFCFDLDSIFARKNPLAAIAAFKKAFPQPAEAHLVIKSVNAERHPEKAAMIEDAVSSRPDISYRDGYLPAGDHHALMAACDAYVSLHRSEGFGLTMAEAMALGKAVIATGYSGNMDFMNDHNSFLVPFEYTGIGAGCEPYPAEALWAEPDIEVAARAIRRVFDDREEARRRGERAIRDIAAFHSPAVRARFIVERISRIREQLEKKGRVGLAGGMPGGAQKTTTGSGTKQESIDPDKIRILEANVAGLINRGPKLDAPTVIPLGKQLRRFMLRLNTNQFLYQQEVNTAILGLIREMTELIDSRSAAGDAGNMPTETATESPWLSGASIIEDTVREMEQRYGESAADLARNLRLLAARMKGFEG